MGSMSVNGTGQQSPASPNGEESKPSPSKRKNDDGTPGSASQPRTKRNRYISIACNECKRRKIKCNGETPCQRCGNLSLDCVYAPNCCSNGFKDSEEYRQMSQHLQSLQDQVNNLFATLADTQVKPAVNGTGSLDPEPVAANGAIETQYAFAPAADGPHAAEYSPARGYTAGTQSSGYYLEQTNGGLRNMTLDHNGVDDGAMAPMAPMAPAAPKPVLSSSASATEVGQPGTSVAKDPLWGMALEDALAALDGYEQFVGSVYPVVDVERARIKARTMFSFLDSMRRVGLMKKESERGDSFCDNETLILKMILALSTTGPNQGESALGQSLFENVRRIINADDRFGGQANIMTLQLVVLTSMYYFKNGIEMLAYRTIGQAARLCFELGLHRGDIVATMFETPESVRDAIHLFWTVYVFDKRSSFGTGLPCVINDNDVDANLPMPDDGYQYLKAMLYYCKLAARLWTSVGGFENVGLMLKLHDMSWIDYQISQWQNSIPEDLRFTHLDFSLSPEEMSRTQKNLRVTLYVRANQLRLQLYRPVFFSAASVMENRGYAQTACEIAKDNIRTLSELDKATDIYEAEQRSFHFYLVSAISVLFLAVAQAPVEFSRQVRDEFYLAMELVKLAKPRSVTMQRLSKTIQNLKKMAPKHDMMSLPGGLGSTNGDLRAPVPALAGGHTHHDAAVNGWGSKAVAAAPHGGDAGMANAAQMAYDLTNLFEVAAGYGDALISKHEALILSGLDVSAAATGMETFASLWRNPNDASEFAKAMKDIY